MNGMPMSRELGPGSQAQDRDALVGRAQQSEIGPPAHPVPGNLQWLVPAEGLEIGGNRVVLEKSGT